MRSDWITKTRMAVRELSDRLAVSDVDDFAPLLAHALETMGEIPDGWHCNALALLLVEVCRTVVATVHARQASCECSCHAAAWELLHDVVEVDSVDPRTAFGEWATRFLSYVAAAHPSSAAQKAAALMRADPIRSWTLRRLASEIGVAESRLSREFVKMLGVRPSAYLHLVRISLAVPMFRAPGKVDAVAFDVGYRSKKDFYAALKRWTGLTPSDVRELPDDESEWLVRELRRRCLQKEAAPVRHLGLTVANVDSLSRADRPVFHPRLPPHQ